MRRSERPERSKNQWRSLLRSTRSRGSRWRRRKSCKTSTKRPVLRVTKSCVCVRHVVRCCRSWIVTSVWQTISVERCVLCDCASLTTAALGLQRAAKSARQVCGRAHDRTTGTPTELWRQPGRRTLRPAKCSFRPPSEPSTVCAFRTVGKPFGRDAAHAAARAKDPGGG